MIVALIARLIYYLAGGEFYLKKSIYLFIYFLYICVLVGLELDACVKPCGSDVGMLKLCRCVNVLIGTTNICSRTYTHACIQRHARPQAMPVFCVCNVHFKFTCLLIFYLYFYSYRPVVFLFDFLWDFQFSSHFQKRDVVLFYFIQFLLDFNTVSTTQIQMFINNDTT